MFERDIDTVLLETVRKRFFSQHSVVSYEERLEGQKVNGNQFVIGMRAGPTIDVGNLFHEMAHFAEREIEALVKFPSNWGFSYGKFWQVGTAWGYEPQTDQQVQREARVWAYQLSVDRELGGESDPDKLVSSAHWLSAWCYYERELGFSNEPEKFRRLSKHVDNMSRNEYNFESFVDSWNKRIEILKNAKPPAEDLITA